MGSGFWISARTARTSPGVVGGAPDAPEGLGPNPDDGVAEDNVPPDVDTHPMDSADLRGVACLDDDGDDDDGSCRDREAGSPDVEADSLEGMLRGAVKAHDIHHHCTRENRILEERGDAVEHDDRMDRGLAAAREDKRDDLHLWVPARGLKLEWFHYMAVGSRKAP